MKINIDKYKREKYKQLIRSKPSRCELSLEWKKSFDNKPGIYVIREKGEIVYVGETSNIEKRMNDLRNTKHHTVRRNIGNTKYNEEKGFQKATARVAYIIQIEKKLEAYMLKHLTIQTLPLDLGRKELEEYIFELHNHPKYNKKPNRRLNSIDKK